MSACAIHHPLTFFLALLKVFGGFPYTLEITKRRTDVVSHDEKNYEALQPKQLVTIKRSSFATAWSIILAVVVVALGCYIISLSRNEDITDTSSTLLTILIYVTVMCSSMLQVSLVLHSKNLASLVLLIQKDITLKVPEIRRKFFILYLTLGMEFFVILGFTTFMVFVFPYSENYNIKLSEIIVGTLIINFFLISPVASYSILYVVSNTMAMSMNAVMNNCFNKWLHPDQEIPKFYLDTPVFVRVSDMVFMRNEEKFSEKARKVSELLMRTDLAIKVLEEYGSGIVITSILFPLYALLVDLYNMFYHVEGYSSALPLVYISFKIMISLCSTQPIVSERQVWLGKLQQLSVRDSNVRDSSEVQFIISQLEKGKKFTPFQLFTLGRHCIIPIVSTVLTYIIIVLQFKMSEDPSN